MGGCGGKNFECASVGREALGAIVSCYRHETVSLIKGNTWG